jgi:hypothetical protein
MIAGRISHYTREDQPSITGNMGGTTTVKEQTPDHMQPTLTTRS